MRRNDAVNEGLSGGASQPERPLRGLHSDERRLQVIEFIRELFSASDTES